MVSKSLIKYIHSLEQKKYRMREQAFVAEGPKVVGDLLSVYRPKVLVATSEWLTNHVELANSIREKLKAEVIEASDEELCRVSFLQHPQQILAVFEIPSSDGCHTNLNPEEQLVLALDNVQDPGNLGTIIRIADWFGIESIVCSLGTADAYNPKVVQATMGSLARVHIIYKDLPTWLRSQPQQVPVYGTLLDGNNIYDENLSRHGIIIMGNEGNGISHEVRAAITLPLLIPNFPAGRNTAESLNVAIATAVVCAEFRRRQIE